MRATRPDPDRPRLFAALELPAAARAALADWAGSLPEDPGVRRVPAENLHVTLVFLGAQPAGEVADIAAAVLAAARPVGALTLTGVEWLSPRRPSVLVADLVEDGQALAALQADLVRALTPWREPEERPFRPHVTLARVRRGQRPRVALPVAPALSLVPAALVLYRSRPVRGGVACESLASARLLQP